MEAAVTVTTAVTVFTKVRWTVDSLEEWLVLVTAEPEVGGLIREVV